MHIAPVAYPLYIERTEKGKYFAHRREGKANPVGLSPTAHLMFLKEGLWVELKAPPWRSVK